MSCAHEEFETRVDMNKFSDLGGLLVADITITCLQCKTKMVFVGVERGLSFSEPRVSADRTELHAPLFPAGEGDPPPIVGVTGFDIKRIT